MIGLDTGRNKAGWIIVIGEEATDCSHITLSKSLRQRTFIKHINVVLEISQQKAVLKRTLLHFDRPMLNNSWQFETLPGKGAMQRQKAGRDRLGWLCLFVGLEEGAYCDD